MKIIVDNLKSFFNVIADLLYYDHVERLIVNHANQKPIFPGQIWLLPYLGRVLVEECDKKRVVYSVLPEDPDDEELGRTYSASSKDFLFWCARPEFIEPIQEDLDIKNSDNVVQLNPRKPE